MLERFNPRMSDTADRERMPLTPTEPSDPGIFLEALLESDREITRTGAGDPYRFYELLHRTATRIAPVEAFYVCLYSEPDRSLYFPHNYDNGKYDFPSTYPLGHGPTSQVIRRKEPLVWNTEHELRELRHIPFGDTQPVRRDRPDPRPGCRARRPWESCPRSATPRTPTTPRPCASSSGRPTAPAQRWPMSKQCRSRRSGSAMWRP